MLKYHNSALLMSKVPQAPAAQAPTHIRCWAPEYPGWLVCARDMHDCADFHRLQRNVSAQSKAYFMPFFPEVQPRLCLIKSYYGGPVIIARL